MRAQTGQSCARAPSAGLLMRAASASPLMCAPSASPSMCEAAILLGTTQSKGAHGGGPGCLFWEASLPMCEAASQLGPVQASCTCPCCTTPFARPARGLCALFPSECASHCFHRSAPPIGGLGPCLRRQLAPAVILTGQRAADDVPPLAIVLCRRRQRSPLPSFLGGVLQQPWAPSSLAACLPEAAPCKKRTPGVEMH